MQSRATFWSFVLLISYGSSMRQFFPQRLQLKASIQMLLQAVTVVNRVIFDTFDEERQTPLMVSLIFPFISPLPSFSVQNSSRVCVQRLLQAPEKNRKYYFSHFLLINSVIDTLCLEGRTVWIGAPGFLWSAFLKIASFFWHIDTTKKLRLMSLIRGQKTEFNEGSYRQLKRLRPYVHNTAQWIVSVKPPFSRCTLVLSAVTLMYCSGDVSDIQPISSFSGWISSCVCEWWQRSFPFPSHDRHGLSASPDPCK